jgi:hypothetical protein
MEGCMGDSIIRCFPPPPRHEDGVLHEAAAMAELGARPGCANSGGRGGGGARLKKPLNTVCCEGY